MNDTKRYTHPLPAVVTEPHPAWLPIESAPRDNKRLLYLARFNPDTGELQELDFDGIWESESESWEMPQVYYFWASACGIEEPTHWAYQDEAIPAAALNHPSPAVVTELVAKAIYSQWADLPGYVPWVERGNSIRQDDARELARAHIAAALTKQEQGHE